MCEALSVEMYPDQFHEQNGVLRNHHKFDDGQKRSQAETTLYPTLGLII